MHQTPKPNDKWRFCIDFRSLNDFSEALGWPIFDVHRLLLLGHKRAKFYRVKNLTFGLLSSAALQGLASNPFQNLF